MNNPFYTSEPKFPRVPNGFNFSAEHDKLQIYVQEILGKAGRLDLRVNVIPYSLMDLLLGGKTAYDFSAGRNPSTYQLGVFYTPGTTAELPEHVIKGILAHEIGHIVHQHYEHHTEYTPAQRRANEEQSDRFAAKLGYADGLIEFFRDIYKEPEWLSAITGDDLTHPRSVDRIKILEEAKKVYA